MIGVGRGGPCGAGPQPGGGDRPAFASEPRAAVGQVGDAERDAWVVLNGAEGVGPVSFGRLIAAFGSAVAVLQASSEAGGPARLVSATMDGADGVPSLTFAAARSIATLTQEPESVLGPVRRAGVAVLVLADAGFPARLRAVELPPPVLFLRGSAAALDRERAVAIVGTRRPTETGRGTAARIADAVAQLGATVVSGLALGIDAAAHRAAVRLDTPTVAVLGGGHGHLYPAGHRGLVEEIIRGGGAVISEFAPETIPTRGTFPRRNRIISGLADATVVIEAGARSGALTTAAWALEQGRGLHIVPGRLDDPAVAGSLAFLREAGPEARIVAGIPELLDDLGLLAPASRAVIAGAAAAGSNSPHLVLSGLPAAERAVAAHHVDGRTSVDELVAGTDLGGATVLGALTALEMRGLVVEAFGRYRPAGPLAAGGARVAVPSLRRPGARAGPGGTGSAPRGRRSAA